MPTQPCQRVNDDQVISGSTSSHEDSSRIRVSASEIGLLPCISWYLDYATANHVASNIELLIS